MQVILQLLFVPIIAASSLTNALHFYLIPVLYIVYKMGTLTTKLKIVDKLSF